jgi:hypothetical protein
MSAGVNYINRRQKDAIEDIDAGVFGDAVADDGSYYWTNVDGTWFKYQAIELVVRKALADDRMQFIGSYTYNWENEGYASGTTTTVFASQSGGWGDSSYNLVNRYGDLDTEHQLKVDGSYTLNFGKLGLVTGLSAYYYSGGVWTPIRRRPGGTEFQEPAGSREIGSQYQFDLHIEGQFTIYKSIVAGAYFDLLNITDEQEPTRIQNSATSASFGMANQWQIPRRYQVGFKLEF